MWGQASLILLFIELNMSLLRDWVNEAVMPDWVILQQGNIHTSASHYTWISSAAFKLE